jgi:hypothetical protein
MVSALNAPRPDAPSAIVRRSLEIGDPAPAFHLVTKSGEVFDPAADHIAGRPLLQVILPRGSVMPSALGRLAEKVRAMNGRSLIIAAADMIPPPGFDLALDPDGRALQSYGADGAPRIVIVAPNRHLASITADIDDADKALGQIAARRGAAAMTNHPPVLVLPDVLSRADCQLLTSVFTMQGHTYLEPGHGAPPHGIGDYKMRIPEYGRKDRIDHWIMSAQTNALIDDRLKRRLFTEILKCFQYRITRREGYRIGCYEGERGGELHGHRDNSRPNVAHRRFACSINLNSEQFEGGAIRFPEFGDQLYRPETGAALVFSSSLLHEPLHVTRGRRYVLLCFLYGDH